MVLALIFAAAFILFAPATGVCAIYQAWKKKPVTLSAVLPGFYGLLFGTVFGLYLFNRANGTLDDVTLPMLASCWGGAVLNLIGLALMMWRR